MQEICKFLVENWRIILEVVLFLCAIIGFFVRKPSNTEIYDASAYSKLIVLVQEAEEKYGAGHGSEKLAYVLDKYIKLMNLDNLSQWDKTSLVIMVERILSTPEKKGSK